MATNRTKAYVDGRAFVKQLSPVTMETIYNQRETMEKTTTDSGPIKTGELEYTERKPQERQNTRH